MLQRAHHLRGVLKKTEISFQRFIDTSEIRCRRSSDRFRARQAACSRPAWPGLHNWPWENHPGIGPSERIPLPVVCPLLRVALFSLFARSPCFVHSIPYKSQIFTTPNRSPIPTTSRWLHRTLTSLLLSLLPHSNPRTVPPGIVFWCNRGNLLATSDSPYPPLSTTTREFCGPKSSYFQGRFRRAVLLFLFSLFHIISIITNTLLSC